MIDGTISMKRVNLIMQNIRYQSLISEIAELEKNRKFCRHTMEHFLDTARIMYILNLEENAALPKDVIYAAALLHDTGRAEEYRNGTPHHKASVDIALHILPECGFDESEIRQITEAIDRHREKTVPSGNRLGELLYRADKLSRQCYSCGAADECYWSDDKKNHTLRY